MKRKQQLKTPADIEHLAAGGAMLGAVLDQLETEVIAGVTPAALDQRARKLLTERGCQPSFLGYGEPPFAAALCVSVNDAVVHGLPTSVPLAEGDVVGLDLGLIYQEKYYLDSARTVAVGAASPKAAHLMNATRQALEAGIAAAIPGNRIGDIGAAVEAVAEASGFGIVRQLVGHGVGFAVHEEPQVPNWGSAGSGGRLKPGLVIAIEPMFTLGSADIEVASDGWTVITADKSLAAHYEHTVAVTADGPRILTTSATL